jgi:hypothetical protein
MVREGEDKSRVAADVDVASEDRGFVSLDLAPGGASEGR